MDMSKKSRNVIFPKKSRRRPNAGNAAGSFAEYWYIYIYIYNMIPPEKSHMAPYEITLFYRNLKK